MECVTCMIKLIRFRHIIWASKIISEFTSISFGGWITISMFSMDNVSWHFSLMNDFVLFAKVDISLYLPPPPPPPPPCKLYVLEFLVMTIHYICASGFTNLTYLSFRKCYGLSAESMKSLSGLEKLVKLDFERCPLIHGGFIHLEGLLLSLIFL